MIDGDSFVGDEVGRHRGASCEGEELREVAEVVAVVVGGAHPADVGEDVGVGLRDDDGWG